RYGDELDLPVHLSTVRRGYHRWQCHGGPLPVPGHHLAEVAGRRGVREKSVEPGQGQPLPERTDPGPVARVLRHIQHPAREFLVPPAPLQAHVAVPAQPCLVTVAYRRTQGQRERLGVEYRQVHALAAHGRHHVRGVAGQEETAVTHRLTHLAAHVHATYL